MVRVDNPVLSAALQFSRSLIPYAVPERAGHQLFILECINQYIGDQAVSSLRRR